MKEFWEAVLQNSEANALHQSSDVPMDDEFDQDDDPLDSLLEGRELGILLRTDYANEEAWQAFCGKLQSAEQELANGLKDSEPAEDTQSLAGPSAASSSTQPEYSDSDEESSDGVPSPIIKVINPSGPHMPLFQNVSNLTALRLLNDVDIRPAPNPPAGQSRIKPPNRLVDQGTWQEIYSGMNIWIYDAQSNVDQCVRFVSQEGDIYGTATWVELTLRYRVAD
ncbi:hypothetical protein H0H92_004964 [Tricholoma furcatifolium]|nr:hypothetical protein H0H92_004964 [Tricholoma furcatifolium]